MIYLKNGPQDSERFRILLLTEGRGRFLENKFCTLATQASQWSEWQSKPHLSSPHHPSTPIHIPSTHTLSHPHRCTLSAIAITYHHRYAITGMPSPSPASKPVRQPASQTARCTPPTATPVHQPDRGGGSVLSSKRWGLRGGWSPIRRFCDGWSCGPIFDSFTAGFT